MLKMSVTSLKQKSLLLSLQRKLSLLSHARNLYYLGLPSESLNSTDLKEVLALKIHDHKKKVAEFRKQYGDTVLQHITVDMIYGGMRSMKALVAETSVLDPEEGIRFRGYSVPECQKMLPKARDWHEPLPEAMWWLLTTGDIPDRAQVEAISKEWAARSDLPDHIEILIKAFPKDLHPMSQFVSAIAALQSESKFAKAYSHGVPKSTYWEFVYEDAMDLIAKVPKVAAMIFRKLYLADPDVGPVDPSKDWSDNFCNMLSYNDPLFTELIRLYMVIHADHEGGNVPAHACTLVGSTLSDPYLAFSAAMAGHAGPLQGLANQEVAVFLEKLTKDLGHDFTEADVKEWIKKHLATGQVVPGYGHAVLRKTDPRFTCQREFALRHLSFSEMFKVVTSLSEITPNVLLEHGKTKNPWPNVDAYSGILLQHFGMTEINFYPVLFGVSRALGCMAQLIWCRAMELPLERPKSHDTESLIKLAMAAPIIDQL